MTPQEKAKELVEKFSEKGKRNWSAAKQCALICVDEFIKWCESFHINDPLDGNPHKKYWQECKQEIEKL